MKNIVLIGLPGSGKTTLGRYLAEMLQRDFIDADPEIEKDTGKTIPELFTISEDCFRQAETATVLRLSRLEGKVLAMGGGVVKRPENITALRSSGLVIFLDRAPAEIVGDVDTSYRPLLSQGARKVYDLYAEREQLYRQAADVIVVNHGPLKSVLQELLTTVREKMGE